MPYKLHVRDLAIEESLWRQFLLMTLLSHTDSSIYNVALAFVPANLLLSPES